MIDQSVYYRTVARVVIFYHWDDFISFRSITMTSEGGDTIGVLNLNTWNATETSVLAYAKTPIQQTFFTNNSDLIGKALRNSINYFVDTLNELDRPACVLGNEFRSTRTHRYQVPRMIEDKAPELVTMEVTTFAPIAFEYIRSVIGITRNDFQQSFKESELINFANTGRSGSQMYKTTDDVSELIFGILFRFDASLLGLYYQNLT